MSDALIKNLVEAEDDSEEKVFAAQDELLQRVIKLYIPEGRFGWDSTYGKGGFYRSGVIPTPAFRSDLSPRADYDSTFPAQWDCRHHLPGGIPLQASIIFDPPFLHACGKESVMGKQFGSYKSQVDLRAMYYASMNNFYSTLQPNGILIFKCQDTVEAGKQQMTHCYVWQMALHIGFIIEDLFILTTKKCMVGWNHHNQKHSRKLCCYFWIMRKPKH